ncbi:Hydrogenase-4 component B / Formate hydrogenlyase subunit 3 [Leptospirillum ferriphilum]|uniref:Hydrogenase 4 subunit B n=1 Tax=Leptospirillum ferriphilum TaxID=178606 RepID=A0A094W7Z1_9BACT|nr:hydrogenase 4 subunit B [Leptospirillum ferriphilum]KGA92575.1 Hydrogenase-4 component B / Formate hydrogenlyase subunit 3 [Leptospirillum ferriphilum]OOH73601.1 hydrogenase 4 subunit B [Leptospirillum ferriphilum]
MTQDGPFPATPLFLAELGLAGWILLGALGAVLAGHGKKASALSFGSLLLPALLASIAGVDILIHPVPQTRDLPFGWPGMPFRLALDPLSGFFLAVLGFVSIPVLLFAIGFFRDNSVRKTRWVLFWLPLFLGTMSGVLLADDVLTFLVFWEGMALSSFFLVVTDISEEGVRKAGFLYLLMAQIGTGLILLSFFLLADGSSPDGGLSSLAFADLSRLPVSPGIAGWVFFLSFAGFGAKAGIVPLHVWLPEAHPVAPSPVSALMSGLMLKIALYGMIRVDLGLLGVSHLQPFMGVAVLAIGSLSALFGVLHALVQHDPKRLLAYHSIENIGIILIGFGLFLIFRTTGHPVPAAVAFSASLFHVLNHALFKSLLFLGAGTILKKTGTHDLNDLGGLFRTMPATSFLFLVGALAISGLPPLNGFLSEWLTFQAALFAPSLSTFLFQSAVVLSAALLALSSALTAMCFVKVTGVSFFGQARSVRASLVREDRGFELSAMAILALGCLGLGLFPSPVLSGLSSVSLSLTGQPLPFDAEKDPWLWLVPVSSSRAQYSPLLLLASFLAVLAILHLLTVLGRSQRPVRTAPTWNCGYPVRTSRMQETADAFGQPVRHFFAPFFRMERHLPSPGDDRPSYHLEVRDPFWKGLYDPLVSALLCVSDAAETIRNRRISHYLLYSVLTLILLLVFLSEGW